MTSLLFLGQDSPCLEYFEFKGLAWRAEGDWEVNGLGVVTGKGSGLTTTMPAFQINFLPDFMQV